MATVAQNVIKYLGPGDAFRDYTNDQPGIYSRLAHTFIEELQTTTKAEIATLVSGVWNPQTMKIEYVGFRITERGAPIPSINIVWAEPDAQRVRRFATAVPLILQSKGTAKAVQLAYQALGLTDVNVIEEGDGYPFDSNIPFDSNVGRLDSTDTKYSCVRYRIEAEGPALPTVPLDRIAVANMIIAVANWLRPVHCRLSSIIYNGVNILENFVVIFIATSDGDGYLAGDLIYQEEYSPWLVVTLPSGDLQLISSTPLYQDTNFSIDTNGDLIYTP